MREHSTPAAAHKSAAWIGVKAAIIATAVVVGIPALLLVLFSLSDSGGTGDLPSSRAVAERELPDGRHTPPNYPLLIEANRARVQGATCGAYPDVPDFSSERVYPPTATLSFDTDLQKSASDHAHYMASTGDYRHQTVDALRAAGARSENIAYIGPTITSGGDGVEISRSPVPDSELPVQFVAGWIASPGHCHNLMQAGWTSIGTAWARAGDGTAYGVQVFR